MGLNIDQIKEQQAQTATGQGFAPNSANKQKRQVTQQPIAHSAAAQPTEPTANHRSVADMGSSALTIRETMSSMAGYSVQSTQALATQRDRIAETVAEQMAALLDPDLFLQDVMERAVGKLQQRTVEIPNFFDITLELPPAPKLKALPSPSESI
jgi:hypothetical protein